MHALKGFLLRECFLSRVWRCPGEGKGSSPYPPLLVLSVNNSRASLHFPISSPLLHSSCFGHGPAGCVSNACWINGGKLVFPRKDQHHGTGSCRFWVTDRGTQVEFCDFFSSRRMNAWESKFWETAITVFPDSLYLFLTMPRTVWKWDWICVKP